MNFVGIQYVGPIAYIDEIRERMGILIDES